MELERKHQPFCAFLRETLRKPECKGLTFQAYILTPVQRIPRYKLLLSDLLKHTPVDHADHVCLTKALAIIESVASFVNERIREQETVVKMVELQKSISGLSEVGLRVLSRNRLCKLLRLFIPLGPADTRPSLAQTWSRAESVPQITEASHALSLL